MLVAPTTADLGPLSVFLEAMAIRLPAIVTDVGAGTEVIQTLLENLALCRQMGERGRELIEQNFNASIEMPKILALTKSAVNKAGKR